MKIANYTHTTFDGVKNIKGWVLVNNYGEKEFVYYNGTELCVHPASDWDGELKEVFGHKRWFVEWIYRIQRRFRNVCK